MKSQSRIAYIYPTTPSQQGCVLGSLTYPDCELFVEQSNFIIEGSFDLRRFKRVWAQLLDHHEILRTAFAWDLGDLPQQIVLKAANLTIGFESVEHLPVEQQSERLENLLLSERTRPFEIKEAPLIRVAVQRRSSDEHVVCWTHHHCILDGWSQFRLMQDMIDCYNGLGIGDVVASFGAYALEMVRQPMEPQLGFWECALRGYEIPPALKELPLTNAESKFGCSKLQVNADTLTTIGSLLDSRGITRASIVLSCMAIVAARFRGKKEILVGVTVAGRSTAFNGLEKVVGPCSNTIPLRVSVAEVGSISDFALSIQASLAEAVQYSDCSTAQIHEWAALPKDRPLFDLGLAFENYPRDERSSDHVDLRIRWTTIQSRGGRTLTPVIAVVSWHHDLCIRLVNDRAKIDDETCRSLLSGFQSIFDRLVSSDLTVKVGEISDGANLYAPTNRDVEFSAKIRNEGIQGGTVEDVVSASIAALLGVNEFNPDVAFISYGGYSILALRLLVILRDAFEVNLTLKDILLHSTAKNIAKHIRRLMGLSDSAFSSLPRITPKPTRDQIFPLSEIQQAYWIGRQTGFELGDIDSHIYAEVDVQNLDLRRFEFAWNRVVDRHPMLRARITPDGEQCIDDGVGSYSISVFDKRYVSKDELELFLQLMRKRLSHQRRSGLIAPLYAIEAVLLNEHVTRLYLSFDLLIGDAQSWRIIYGEVFRVYFDPTVELEELEITYRDYICALVSLKDARYIADAQTYWEKRVETMPNAPKFPFVCQPSALVEVRFCRRQERLDAPNYGALQKLAMDWGVTPSVVLLQIFAEIIARFTGDKEFIVNLTIFDRLPLHPQIDQIVGDFTSLLIVSISTGGRFHDKVRFLQRQLWSDLDHRQYSGFQVLRRMAQRSDSPLAARAPVVFTSTLDFGRATDPLPPLPGDVVYSVGQTPQVAFDYQVYESATGIVISWDTVDGLFPIGYLDEMFKQHSLLLKSIILDRIDSEDTAYVEKNGERKGAGDSIEQSFRLHSLFVEHAKRSPDRAAVICPGRTLNYGELLALSTHSASELKATSGDFEPVGILIEKGWQQIAAALACLYVGRPFIPLDTAWPVSRIEYCLNQAGASKIFIRSDESSRWRFSINIEQHCIDEVCGGEDLSIDSLDVCANDNDVAYIIFTSGSTGTPKGVAIQHSAVVNTVLDINKRFGIGPNDTTFGLSSFAFDLSIFDIFGILSVGGALVLPSESDRLEPERWMNLISAEQVTIWNSTPALLELLTDFLQRESSQPLASLRVCLLSGDWIPLSLPNKIRKLTGPDVRLVGLGGATETSIWSVFHEIAVVLPGWDSIPYGKPLSGQWIEVVTENLTPCPDMVDGELLIGGKGVAMGYVGDDALTRDRFVVTGADQRRCYRTGDRGRRHPDGSIEFLGRLDSQIKIAGQRLDLREIETALESLSGVRSATVICTGEGRNNSLAAFVIGRKKPSDIRRDLAAKIPVYMIPATIELLDKFPLSSMGKVDRVALIALINERANEIGPANVPDFGSRLHSIVASIIGRYPTSTENLLELGLTSLGAIRLLNAVERDFGVRPKVIEFYARPTVENLNATIRIGLASNRKHATESMTGSAITSLWTQDKVLADPIERLDFRAARPIFLDAKSTLGMHPSAIDKKSGLERRRSPALFSKNAVNRDSLYKMLDCLRQIEINGKNRFTYPSAGGLYGVDVYVHIRPGRIAGLAAGLYYYHPRLNELCEVFGKIDLDGALHVGENNLLLGKSCAFLIFLTTNPSSSVPLYGADAEHLNLLNAGYMGQLLCEASEKTEISLCPLFGYDYDAIRWLFPGGENSVLLHFLAGGIASDRSSDEDIFAWGGDGSGVFKKAAQAPCDIDATVAAFAAPLSPGQERLLEDEYKNSDGSWPVHGEIGNLRSMDTGSFLIEGALDICALRTAFDVLVEEQAALRTTFRFSLYCAPVQIVAAFSYSASYLNFVKREIKTEDIPAFVARHSAPRISPTSQRLFHSELFEIDNGRYLLFINIHHLVSDGWSVNIIYRRISELYRSAIGGGSVQLKKNDVEFFKACISFQNFRKTKRARAQIEYWVKELHVPPYSNREQRRWRDSVDGMHPVSVKEILIDGSLLSRLRLVSLKSQVSGGIGGTILCALAAVIHLETRTAVVDVGSMIAGRTNIGVENVVGNFVNTVAIKIPFYADDTLSGLLGEVNRKLAQAMENQEVPIQDVLKALEEKYPDQTDYVPPYTITVALNDRRGSALTLGGTKCVDVSAGIGDLLPRRAPMSKALRWVLDDLGHSMRGTVTYNTNLYSEEKITSWILRFLTCLSIMSEETQSIPELMQKLGGCACDVHGSRLRKTDGQY